MADQHASMIHHAGWEAPVRGVLINQPYLTGGVIIDYFPLLGCKLILQV